MSSDGSGRVMTLQRPGEPELAYELLAGTGPTTVFLGGFRSDMTGTKATAVRDHCARHGWSCLRLDYSGHGASGGEFAEGSIGRWTGDALAVIDAVTCGPLLLMGSSMGAWIMILVALSRTLRVAGMVGVAAAPDFTEDLIWQSLPPDQQRTLRHRKRLVLPGRGGEPELTLGWELIADGRRRRVLHRSIPFTGPVQLLHGLEDEEVPWETSVRLAQAIDGPDVSVTLLRGGDHRLSAPPLLDQVLRALGEVRGRLSAD